MESSTKFSATFLAVLGLLTFVVAPIIAQGTMENNDRNSIAEIASSNDQFSTLVTALKAVDLVDSLENDGPFTVFAPTNQAFKSLPDGKLQDLLKSENSEKLKQLLTYHVVPKRITFGDVMAIDGVRSSEGVMIGTLQGQNIRLKVEGDDVVLNGSTMVVKSIKASNGVIHVIDGILEKGSVTNQSALKILHRTIQQGAPMYNRGHHKQTADLYYKRSKMIVNSSNEAVSSKALEALRHATSLAEMIRDDSSRAWALRYGMNAAMKHMTETMSGQRSM